MRRKRVRKAVEKPVQKKQICAKRLTTKATRGRRYTASTEGF